MEKKEKKFVGNSKAFSTILKVVGILLILMIIACLVKTCAECNYKAHIVDKTGYLPTNDDWDNIPNVEPPYYDDDTLNLPKQVSLERYFPPIGDQGEKGTCVAWATGYNLKTALNAIDGHWTKEKLEQPSNQTSPQDLWLSIPQMQKGEDCSGTGFEAAFNVLTSSGVASMEEVPYENLKGCDGIGMGDTTNRLLDYCFVTRNGDLPKVGELKAYLNDTIPLVIGAHLGDRFMRWKNDKVINYDTYNYTGMHAYHAMALVGYDDSRQAFRLRNSWGTDWGDKGSIWVDYGFFCREFCFVVFMAKNGNPGSK